MRPWPDEELHAVEEVVAQRLEGLIEQQERVAVSGSSGEAEVRATFVLSGGPRGERVEIEARVARGPSRLDEEAMRALVLDALDWVLLEYLESGRSVRFSGVFEDRDLRGQPVAVRAERTFPSLEAEADALLLRAPADGEA